MLRAPTLINGKHDRRFRTPAAAEIPLLAGTDLGAATYGERIAGDFHDFAVAGSRLLFLLADVSGEYNRAQEIAATLQETFRSAASELFSSAVMNEADAMVELMLRLNRQILESAGGVCNSTAFAGCYNSELGTICYTNAGHVPGLIRDRRGIEELRATGIPLGLFSHATHDAPTCAIGESGSLLLVSRGVIEGKRKRAEFGLGGVKRVFQNASGQCAHELCAAVLNAVEEFMGKAPVHNDVTAIALVRK